MHSLRATCWFQMVSACIPGSLLQVTVMPLSPKTSVNKILIGFPVPLQSSNKVAKMCVYMLVDSLFLGLRKYLMMIHVLHSPEGAPVITPITQDFQ